MTRLPGISWIMPFFQEVQEYTLNIQVDFREGILFDGATLPLSETVTGVAYYGNL